MSVMDRPATRRGYQGPDFTPAELDDVADALERADARGMTPSAVQRAAGIVDFDRDDVGRTRAILTALETDRRVHRVATLASSITARWFPGRATEPAPDPDTDLHDEYLQDRQWNTGDDL